MRTTSCTIMILSDGQRMDMETLIEIYFIESFIKIVEERPSISYNLMDRLKNYMCFHLKHSVVLTFKKGFFVNSKLLFL
jgi:hypothetical protein